MRVCMHDRRFSPCNANVRLVKAGPPVVSFFSLAIDASTFRAVVTYHVLPVGDPPADAIRGWMRGRNTLGALIAGVDEHLGGDPAHFLRAMLGPLVRIGAPGAAPCADPAGASAPASGAGAEVRAAAPSTDRASASALGSDARAEAQVGAAAPSAPESDRVAASGSTEVGGGGGAASSAPQAAKSDELDGMDTE